MPDLSQRPLREMCALLLLGALLGAGGASFVTRVRQTRGADEAIGAARPPLSLPSKITPAWRNAGRARLARLLHLRPGASTFVPKAVPLPNLRLLGSDRVLASFYRFVLSDGTPLFGGTVVPKHGTGLPWVVVLHGHGPGLSVVFDRDSYQKGVALTLAENGFNVLAVETRSFGSSLVEGLRHDVYVNSLLLEGRVFHGEVVSDNIEVLNWLHDSDKLSSGQPLGVVGCSVGALSAMLLVALDDRAQAALLSGMGGSWRDSFSHEGHCHCSMIPGLLQHMDSPQIVALSRCRHIAFELGTRDDLLGVENFRPVARAMRSIKGRHGPEITVHEFEGGHEHDLAFVLSFFRRTLWENPHGTGNP